MKEVSQETKSLTAVEDKMFGLIKHLSPKISLFSLYESQEPQQEQHIFYLPLKNEIILSKPFIDERRLFHLLLELESFIIRNSIVQITVITSQRTGSLVYPFANVNLVPFDMWSLSI